ncbi:hypothetical protein B4140_3397 [Bacillus sp. CN2]|nr:hypothetical protein BCBMB205_33700 [Bacillus velezensis]ARZ59714.1 hypothetical protein BAGQ_3510 [Bacillus velezensis]KYC91442.1 hypothetical protein B4140_3397 [Bacillus amyloliquefaciens]RUR97000.1 hypothetical protein EFW57_03239 [Bacillus velezensis]GFR54785.1 hypothetical protein B4140_3397 [Bacillus sp. CN2]
MFIRHMFSSYITVYTITDVHERNMNKTYIFDKNQNKLY